MERHPMQQPGEVIFHEGGLRFPPMREQDVRLSLLDEAWFEAPTKPQRLAALQQERREMSRILRWLTEAVPCQRVPARRGFLDAWCRRVWEIELEMDRLRKEILSEVKVPPVEIRLIRRLFAAHRSHDRARRRGTARTSSLCRSVAPRRS
jgi:hypothetical protein